LFGKGVTSRSVVLSTALEAEDFWWDSAAKGKKCNGLGVCDFYSQQIQSDVLFMGEYRTDSSIKFKLHRNYTSCRDNVNNNTKHTNKVELSECIRQAFDSKATAFVYSEPYNFIWDESTMPKSGQKSKFPFAVRTNVMNKRGYISTIEEGERWYEIVSASTGPNYIPTPNPNGDHTFHPWKEKDCQMVTSECVMTVKLEYNLYKVGQTGQGDERSDGASFDRFDTCLTYDDGKFKTVIGNYVTKTYENGQDPFLGGHCPKGHFCTATGIGNSTVGYKEACPPGYFQPELTQTRTGSDIRCSQMGTSHANCTENLATKRTDYVDKICKRCQPNEYAPEGSSACTACPAGRVKKQSGNMRDEDKKKMYNIPISLSGTYWYYMEDETGFEMSDCALVPSGIVHVPEADQFMTADDHRFLPVFPCPFAYSSPPGTYVIDGHDEVTRLLQKRTHVIRAPFANVDTDLGEEFAKVMKEFAKEYCFVCPSSSITGHGSTTCTTCFQDRTAFSTKEIINSIVAHTQSQFNDHIIGVGTQLAGLPVTHKIRIGQGGTSHTWILGVIDRENSASDRIYLKMVKIEIGPTDEGVNTFVWKEASKLQITPATATCQGPTTFNEACFTDGSPETDSNTFSVTLVTRPFTCYDHWNGGNQIRSVPNTENTLVRNDIVEGLAVITTKQVSIAEMLGYCNYNFPAYIGIIVNDVTVQDTFKHTCIESVGDECTQDVCPYKSIHLNINGSWATEYPLCLGCESGKSNNVEIVGQCVDCLPGYFTSTMEQASESSCQSCQRGFYTDMVGSLHCIACPQGYEQDNKGQNDCVECQAGSYQDTDGQPQCKKCDDADGQYIATPASISPCKVCTAGTKYTSSLSVCAVCDGSRGEYNDQDHNKNGECKRCENGEKWVSTLSPCTSCPPGKYGDNIVHLSNSFEKCHDCPAGFFTDKPSQIECTPCPKGKYQSEPSQDKCSVCGPGEYQPETKQTTCIPTSKGHEVDPDTDLPEKQKECGTNKYSKAEDTQCHLCPTGWETGGMTSASCRNCSPGEFGATAGSWCEFCERGQYSDQTAASSCKYCPKGFLSSHGGQAACANKCLGGMIVNHEGVKGTCQTCRMIAGHNDERTCYCNFFLKCEVMSLVNMVTKPSISSVGNVFGTFLTLIRL